MPQRSSRDTAWVWVEAVLKKVGLKKTLNVAEVHGPTF